MDNKRHRDEDDGERVGEDHPALEAEEDDEGEEKPCLGYAVELLEEDALEPFLAPTLDEPKAGDRPEPEGNDDEEDDGEEQGIPGHVHIADAEQEGDDGREGEEDDQVVDRHLDHRITRVAVGQVGPDKDHRGAGSGSEEDSSGEVFGGKLAGDQGLKDHFQEEGGNEVHGEGLDEPIHHQSDDEALGLLARILDAGEVDLEHHGIDHEPDEQGYGDRNLGVFELTEERGHAGQEVAYGHAEGDAQGDPHGKVLGEETDAALIVIVHGSSFAARWRDVPSP